MSAWGFTSILALIVSAGLVSAAEPPDRSPADSTDIIITSHSLVFRNQDNTAVFEGKVAMTKGMFVMHADQMIIYFDGAPAAGAPKDGSNASTQPKFSTPDLPVFGNRAVSLIDATGNVAMQQGTKRARSKKALYYQREEKLVLTGDPEVWEEGYRVTGSKMTMLLKEDRSIVESSRVIISDTKPTPR